MIAKCYLGHANACLTQGQSQQQFLKEPGKMSKGWRKTRTFPPSTPAPNSQQQNYCKAPED